MIRLLPCIILFSFFFMPVAAQEELKTLDSVITAMDQYRDREITMQLRLKHVDAIFEKIVFYDGNNHDIVFDISDKKKKKALRSQMLTVHEGMEYSVTFLVKGAGALGMVIGDLIDFKPVIMSHIPE